MPEAIGALPPQIAWTYSDPSVAKPLRLRRAIETAFLGTMEKVSAQIGDHDIENIVLSDNLPRAVELGILLRRYQHRSDVPREGLLTDRDLPERLVISPESEAHSNENTWGMLQAHLTGKWGHSLILLDTTAAWASPMGLTHNPQSHRRAVGVLAHEMGHSADFARGRPGRPDFSTLMDHENPDVATLLFHAMEAAQSEFMAVRSECKVQDALFGGITGESFDRIDRFSETASDSLRGLANLCRSREKPMPMTKAARDEVAKACGYAIGTICAYASSGVAFINDGGHRTKLTAQAAVEEMIDISPGLAGFVDTMLPALERSAAPDREEAQKADLYAAFEKSIQTASPRKGRAGRTRASKAAEREHV